MWMAVEATIRKWGNSLGLVLPSDFVCREKLKEEDTVVLEVVKKADLRHLFGSLKGKMSGQEFKNMAREGW
jgi:antitoxin component of MazEF toxin-antitoxin module